MAEQTETKQRFALDKANTSRLDELKAKRQAFSADVYKSVENRTEKLRQIESLEELGKETAIEQSELEKALSHGKEFESDIGTLLSGLTGELEAYTTFAEESKNYQGVEKLAKFFRVTAWADKQRRTRLKTQTPEKNLELVLEYADQLVAEINVVRENAIETYSNLELNGDIITAKIAEYQPKVADLKERLDAMESAYSEIDTKWHEAEPTEQAILGDEKNEMHKNLANIQNEYDQVFTVYNQAKQTWEMNNQARDAFHQMVRDLGRQSTMVTEKAANLTEIYRAAPDAIKIMMTTAGMESFDKAANYAADASVNLITMGAGAVSAATQEREAIQVIPDEKMREYITRMQDGLENFKTRYAAIERSSTPKCKRKVRIGVDMKLREGTQVVLSNLDTIDMSVDENTRVLELEEFSRHTRRLSHALRNASEIVYSQAKHLGGDNAKFRTYLHRLADTVDAVTASYELEHNGIHQDIGRLPTINPTKSGFPVAMTEFRRVHKDWASSTSRLEALPNDAELVSSAEHHIFRGAFPINQVRQKQEREYLEGLQEAAPVMFSCGHQPVHIDNDDQTLLYRKAFEHIDTHRNLPMFYNLNMRLTVTPSDDLWNMLESEIEAGLQTIAEHRLHSVANKVEDIPGIQIETVERYVVGPYLSKFTENDASLTSLIGNEGILLLRKYAVQRVGENPPEGVMNNLKALWTNDWAIGKFGPQIEFPQVAIMPHRLIQEIYNTKYEFDRQTQAYSG